MLGSCQENAEPIRSPSSPQESPKFSLAFPLISIAHAQEKDRATQDTSALIKQLNASASYLRQDARSQLAKKGITVVRPLLVTLSQDPLSYRSRLGVIVALTEMMRENKGSRREIINNITPDDLARLVDASADEDRTIRIYASEFLYDLGDPRTIPLCMAKFPAASENGRYNLLLVIQGAVPFVPKGKRSKVVEDVTALKSPDTTKINKLIDSIVELAK